MESSETYVRDLVKPLATDLGLDLVDVDLKGGSGQRLLRVIVDRKGGVTLGACQELSRRLSRDLDSEDVIDDRYSLEVTSPGTDHPLRDAHDFDRVEGRAVLIHRNVGEGRVEQLRGTVAQVREDAVVLDVDGDDIPVPYTRIVKATQTLPW